MRRPTAFLVLLLLAIPAGTAEAGSYPVTTAADSGAGSLRTAIAAANGDAIADTIPIQTTGTIELATPLPEILHDVAIDGPGAAELAVERKSGAAAFRIFTFASTADGSLSGIAVRNGHDPLGAGILAEGDLTLTRVVLAGNEAGAEGGSQAVARGGGVASLGTLLVSDSTITDNVAFAAGGAAESTADGGGIAAADATIERSTISGNTAATPKSEAQSSGVGGGIEAGGEVEITGSTIVGNSVSAGLTAVGSNLAGPGFTVRNTIVANPLGEGSSCFGIVASGGFNLDEDGSCHLDGGSDLNGAPAGLDPVLRDNGGPTPTHALLSGSRAIDRGNSFGSTTDQRGLPRPSDFPSISNREGGDGSDIGAFELQAPPIDLPAPSPPILVSAEPGDRTPPRTRIVSGPARVGFERKATFRFSASEGQSSFQCRLDRKRWQRCHSPRTVRVRPGKHLFRVRAIDRFGNADPTPARFGWRVKPVG